MQNLPPATIPLDPNVLHWKQKVSAVIQSCSILGTVFKKNYAAGKQVDLLPQIEQRGIEILCVTNEE